MKAYKSLLVQTNLHLQLDPAPPSKFENSGNFHRHTTFQDGNFQVREYIHTYLLVREQLSYFQPHTRPHCQILKIRHSCIFSAHFFAMSQ